MLFNLFKNARSKKEAAREMKAIIVMKRDDAKKKQTYHHTGSDFWHRYQWQINMCNDFIDKINLKFNI